MVLGPRTTGAFLSSRDATNCNTPPQKEAAQDWRPPGGGRVVSRGSSGERTAAYHEEPPQTGRQPDPNSRPVAAIARKRRPRLRVLGRRYEPAWPRPGRDEARNPGTNAAPAAFPNPDAAPQHQPRILRTDTRPPWCAPQGPFSAAHTQPQAGNGHRHPGVVPHGCRASSTPRYPHPRDEQATRPPRIRGPFSAHPQPQAGNGHRHPRVVSIGCRRLDTSHPPSMRNSAPFVTSGGLFLEPHNAKHFHNAAAAAQKRRTLGPTRRFHGRPYQSSRKRK
jgi:hypothetical protein